MKILIGPLRSNELVGEAASSLGMKCVADRDADVLYRLDQDSFCDILSRLPGGWTPDVVVWWSPEYNPPPVGIEDSPYPTVAAVGDWNLGFTALHHNLKRFDRIVTDRAGVEIFQKAGYTNVDYWPMFSFDPRIHRRIDGIERVYDIVMVGNFNHEVQRERSRWLARVAGMSDRYSVRLLTGVYGDEYARLLNQAKIVFNRSIRREMNMRAYEAPACGAVLFLEDENLEVRDVFEDRVECVLYNEKNFDELIDYYLARDADRQAIADAGRKRVLEETHVRHFERLMSLLSERGLPSKGRSRRSFFALPAAARLYHQGLSAVQGVTEGALQAAGKALGQALQATGDDPNLWNAIGVFYGICAAQLGDCDARATALGKAADTLAEACRLAPHEPLPLYNLAGVKLALGLEDEAESALAGAVGLLDQPGKGDFECRDLFFPRVYDAFRVEWERVTFSGVGDDTALAAGYRRLLLWKSCERMGDLAGRRLGWEEAEGWYRRSVEAGGDLASDAMVKLAAIVESTGRTDDAIGLYRTALAEAPFNTAGWRGLAGLLRRHGRFEESTELCNGLLRIVDSCPFYERERASLQQAPHRPLAGAAANGRRLREASGDPFRILTFNWHAPYLALLAKTGHQFFIADWMRRADGQTGWSFKQRPLPGNVSLLSDGAEIRRRAEAGAYDLVLCHTLQDVEFAHRLEIPSILLSHTTPRCDACGDPDATAKMREAAARFLAKPGRMFVAISEMKLADWGLPGTVIRPGIDAADYGGYEGGIESVLVVGNLLRERAFVMGYELQLQILAGFPHQVIGFNPSITGARESKSWDDLKALYRAHRVFLSTTLYPYDDGYNLSLLEAMATGMPVVSWGNETSPVIDGVNGYVASDVEVLRGRTGSLLADRDLARALGQAARATVVERFPIAAFLQDWDRAFRACLGLEGGVQGQKAIAHPIGAHGLHEVQPGASLDSPPISAVPRPESSASSELRPIAEAALPRPSRPRLLFASISNPISNATYYERAFRGVCDVFTCGPTISRGELSGWKELEDQHAFKQAGAGDVAKIDLIARLARPMDIPLPKGQVEVEDILKHLPKGWEPDLFVWIDNGSGFLPLGMDRLACPSACLIGDTHTGQMDWRLQYARLFSHTFVMFNRQHVPAFADAGCRNASWLPAACDPAIHGRHDVEKAYDVCFIGQTLRKWHPDRVRLLERLVGAGIDVYVDSKILEEMALAFSRSRVIFNRSLNGDLNMRVFEALCSGSLLLTDRLPPESGLEDLFTDGEHLVLYDDSNLEDLAMHYLADAAERERIAACGMDEVLARHTYGDRARQVLASVLGETFEPEPESKRRAESEATPRLGVSGDTGRKTAREVACELKSALVPGPVNGEGGAGVAHSRVRAEGRLRKEVPAYFRNPRPEVVQLIPGECRRILDVGCGSGEMGAMVKRQRPDGSEVYGIELDADAARQAEGFLDGVVTGDIEEMEVLPFESRSFDCIVLADILEHLRDPEAALRRLSGYLRDDGFLVCSIPNIRHATVLLNLMVGGRWQYADEGLLDRTHIHFFTLSEIHAMMARLGYRIETTNVTVSVEDPRVHDMAQLVGRLGGDEKRFREEARVLQYIFRAAPLEKGQAAGASIAPGTAPSPVKASIVIPVRDRLDYTRRCLAALAETTGDVDHEVIVVDNGSRDGTPDYLQEMAGLRIITNAENLGFARACNQAAKQARGEFLLFLNNDTIPHEHWLLEMLSVSEKDPSVGVVGCKLIYPGTGKIQHAGIELIGGVPDHPFRLADADDPRVNVLRELDMVTGACMLVRKSVFQGLGGFDEGYQNGVEDVDLCLRVRQTGLKVVYCPNSVVEHHEAVSDGRFSAVRENLQRFFQRWAGHFDEAGRLRVHSVAAEGQVEGAEAKAGAVGRPPTKAEKKLRKKEMKRDGRKKRLAGQIAASGLPAAGGSTRWGRIRVVWEGSQFVWHSLALVNRELCIALARSGRCDLSIVPYEAHQFGAEADPRRFGLIAERLDRKLQGPADVYVRHTWPPSFTPPREGKWVVIQPWEFGRIPVPWREPYERLVDEIWVPTNYVRQCLIDSGVSGEKVVVIPNGVNPDRFNEQVRPYPLKTRKRFKFLYVGGAIERKGIDILLKAFPAAFSDSDDVCLVIKDMGLGAVYEDPTYREKIRELQSTPGAPELVYIPDYLSEEEIAGLYRACDCLVHPYRGEGFGLPVAEAMASGLPVIVTQGGATDDFCSDETVFWLPARRVDVTFDHQTTLLFGGEIPGAWLLNPDWRALAERMQYVVGHSREAGQKARLAQEHIRQEFTWDRPARMVIERLSDLRGGVPVRSPKVAEAPVPAPAGGERGAAPGSRSHSVQTARQARESERAIESAASADRAASGEQFLPATGSPSDDTGMLLALDAGQADPEPSGDATSEAAGLGSDGSSADSLILEGERLFTEGDLLTAQERFRDAIAQEPVSVRAHNDLGVAAWKVGDLHTALSSFSRALEMDQWSGDALANSAEVYLALGYRDEAIVRLRRYLQVNGEDTSAREKLNNLLREKGAAP